MRCILFCWETFCPPKCSDKLYLLPKPLILLQQEKKKWHNITVKKIFRIRDEFAHNYVICVTILCPTLTKMDTLIIQNKLRILRNGFQNSRNPFPILVDFRKSGKDYRYSVINYRYSIIFSVPSFYKFSFHIRQSCNYPQEGSLV